MSLGADAQLGWIAIKNSSARQGKRPSMIVSELYGFAFIKTRKTAGTSLEIALSEICGPDDIVTRILEDRENIRNVSAQNDRLPFCRAAAVDVLSQVVRLERPRLKFYNHIPIGVASRYLDLSGLYTFTVERNPWDRAISNYFWRTKDIRGPKPTMSTFLRNTFRSNFPLYSHEGKMAVNRVLRYENLDAEFHQVWRDLELPGTPVLPRAKSGLRRPMLLDAKDVELIADRCHQEIELFGYSPPPGLIRRG
jgi:hypothetical protein